VRRTRGPETLAAIVALAILSGAACGEDAALHSGLERFFKVGWSTAPSAYQPTIEIYQELRRIAPADRRVPYAAALVLMQQRKYDLAAKRIDELLADDENDLTAWRARVWLSTITRNYSAAMAAADKSVRLLPVEGKTEFNEATRDYVASLGRIFGYLGGPASEQVKGPERKATEKGILERLGPELQEVFIDARDSVLDRFLKLTDSAADSRDRAKEEAEKEQAKALDDIQKEREGQEDRKRELEERQSKLQSELKDRLAELTKQDAPLQRDQAAIQAQAGPLQSNLATLDLEIGRLQTLLTREKDPRQRDFYRFEIDRLVLRGNRLRNDLGLLERQLAAVTGQRAALQAQAAQARAEVGGQIDRGAKELGGIEKKGKQLDGLENRASRPVSGTTSRTAALGAQAGALTTYEPFPLEVEKQRVLDSFR
jgi:hypothetical protein